MIMMIPNKRHAHDVESQLMTDADDDYDDDDDEILPRLWPKVYLVKSLKQIVIAQSWLLKLLWKVNKRDEKKNWLASLRKQKYWALSKYTVSEWWEQAIDYRQVVVSELWI